jgi:hypothetical protein
VNESRERPEKRMGERKKERKRRERKLFIRGQFDTIQS